MRDLIKEGDFEAAAGIGGRRSAPARRSWTSACRTRSRRDRRRRSVHRTTRRVKVPLMIDSTDAAAVMEQRSPGARASPVLELDQPRGRAARLREGRATGATLRRRGGGRADRRDGDGRHGRAQARGGRKRASRSSTEAWGCAPRRSGGSRWSSPAAPATKLHRSAPPPSRRWASQARDAGKTPTISASRTSSFGSTSPPAARSSTRSSSITPPRPGSTSPSSATPKARR